jgi:beta-glucosidase
MTLEEKVGQMAQITIDLYISDLQTRLALEIAKTGKPVVLVLNEGRPRVISKFENKMRVVVQAYLPGNFSGDTLADILFGDANPSGKLPYTYPRYPNSLINYWHNSEQTSNAEGIYNYEADFNPQYIFGAGLSYTTFEYSNLKLSANQYSANDDVEITVSLKNSGLKDGKEALLVFVSDLYASLSPDMKRLRAFDKVFLRAGESKDVSFSIPMKDLAFIGLDNIPKLEPGDFSVSVGGLKQKFTLK